MLRGHPREVDVRPARLPLESSRKLVDPPLQDHPQLGLDLGALRQALRRLLDPLFECLQAGTAGLGSPSHLLLELIQPLAHLLLEDGLKLGSLADDARGQAFEPLVDLRLDPLELEAGSTQRSPP